MRSPSRLLVLIAAGAILVAVACSSGSDASTGPGTTTIGFTFQYTDTTGRTLTFTADSGTWSRDIDTTFFFTNLFAAAPVDLNNRVQFQFSNGVSLASAFVPLGKHDLLDTLDLNLNLAAYQGIGLLGVADSGSITFTRSDDTVLAGRLNAYLSNPNPLAGRPPFHLSGSFRLSRAL
jgi:hypothetical protein